MGELDKVVTVREYARLTTSPLSSSSSNDKIDCAQISESAFDWLCGLAAHARGQAGAHILQVEDRRSLRLDNYVGVVGTPCGLRLEILPKHVDHADAQTTQRSRALLRRMLEAAMNLRPRESGPASVEQFDLPLSEWVANRFLEALSHVTSRGLRRDYVRVEEEQPFLRGQLDIVRQMRSPPGRAHLFQIRHDVFSVDRAENRLLRSALLKVSKNSQAPGNWRRANELLNVWSEVPESRNQDQDFLAWRRDRLMAHYEPARPWCELVLGDQMPMALAGGTRGISLLFPMEKLFERYVGQAIRAQLPQGYKLTEQSARHWLCRHGDSDFFQLRPDFLIEGGGKSWILDAKWKLLDGGARERHYEIKQSDFYQLHAYGQRYLNGQGELALVYPKTTRFGQVLGPFRFSEALSLHALPFDLELCRLPEQAWMSPFKIA